jgi:hypothetical protein
VLVPATGIFGMRRLLRGVTRRSGMATAAVVGSAIILGAPTHLRLQRAHLFSGASVLVRVMSSSDPPTGVKGASRPFGAATAPLALNVLRLRAPGHHLTRGYPFRRYHLPQRHRLSVHRRIRPHPPRRQLSTRVAHGCRYQAVHGPAICYRDHLLKKRTWEPQ